LLLLGIAALVAGVLVITRHHHPRPYSMSSDTRPRLPDGRVASATGMSVADAIGRQPARLVAVHGYLEAAADDRPYLCGAAADRDDGHRNEHEPMPSLGCPLFRAYGERAIRSPAVMVRVTFPHAGPGDGLRRAAEGRCRSAARNPADCAPPDHHH
jgi:hypothetical protein